jgi:F-type H+-transporting ATPase subunit epsilon
MADTLKLEIVTPESKIYSEDVEVVTLPGSEGEAGIYPNHVPLMTQVQAGEILVNRGGTEEVVAIGEGFAEITGEHVAILTDNAANSADIDEAAAEEAKAKAEQRSRKAATSPRKMPRPSPKPSSTHKPKSRPSAASAADPPGQELGHNLSRGERFPARLI